MEKYILIVLLILGADWLLTKIISDPAVNKIIDVVALIGLCIVAFVMFVR